MSTNIKAIRVYLPDTEDHSKLDVTDAFVAAIGADTDQGFDGITAEFDERLTQSWSLHIDRPGYTETLYTDWQSGYKILSDVANHIEDNGGPMMRVEGDHEVIVWVEVEDGGITIDTLLVDDGRRVTVDGVLTMAGLTLEVDLLDPSELGEPENPRAIERIEGKIIRADGTSTEFSIGTDGYQQWGGITRELGETVHLVSAMTDAAREHFPTDEHDDEE